MQQEIMDYDAVTVGVVLREKPELSAIAAVGVSHLEDLDTGRTGCRLEVLELLQTADEWVDVLHRAEHIANLPALWIIEKEIVVEVSEGDTSTVEAVGDIDGQSLTGTPIILNAEREIGYLGGCMTAPLRDVAGSLLTAFREGLITVGASLELAALLEQAISEMTLRTAQDIGSLALSVALCSWRGRQEYGPLDTEPKPYNPKDWAKGDWAESNK